MKRTSVGTLINTYRMLSGKSAYQVGIDIGLSSGKYVLDLETGADRLRSRFFRRLSTSLNIPIQDLAAAYGLDLMSREETTKCG